MPDVLNQFFNLFITPPGTLIYHLVLAFSILMALQAILLNRAAMEPRTVRRQILGLSLLLLGQVALFLGSALGWLASSSPAALLPLLERFITTLSLVWIIWLWAFPEKQPFADIAVGLLTLIIVSMFVFTQVTWGKQPAGTAFNSSWLDWGWQLFTLCLGLAGIIALLLQHKPGWGVGLAQVGLLLGGVAAHLIWADAAGNFPAPIRLAQLCAYPLLPILAQRLSAPSARALAPAAPPKPAPEVRRYLLNPPAIAAWLKLASASGERSSALARAIAQTMNADLCYLLSPQTGNSIPFAGGYDLLSEETLPPFQLELSKAPALAGALQRNRPLRLGRASENSPELKSLAEAIGLENPGSLLFMPLSVERPGAGGILLLSPYSKRDWNAEDQSFIAGAADLMRQALEPLSSTPASSSQVETLRKNLEIARNDLVLLQQEHQALTEEIQQLRSTAKKAAPGHEVESRMDAVIAIQNESQKVIQELKDENERLRKAIQTSTPINGDEHQPNLDHLENELHQALEDNARLQNMLAGANMKVLALEMQNPQATSQPIPEEQEMLTSLAQELRQPLSSINGYTYLLLSESVGILGALQKKFMERIQSSSDRMGALVDDLIQVTSLQTASLHHTPNVVYLSDVVDTALDATSGLMRAKEAGLRVNIPDDLPPMHIEQHTLEQILVQLLQNACSVTPAQGEVILNARMEMSEDRPYLLLQVTDQGGGIAPADLGRVFNRRFRAEHSLIPGVGDAGVGLSIAKALVEAQGGRIWVESKQPESSTYSVLLPITTPSSPQA